MGESMYDWLEADLTGKTAQQLYEMAGQCREVIADAREVKRRIRDEFMRRQMVEDSDREEGRLAEGLARLTPEARQRLLQTVGLAGEVATEDVVLYG